MNLDHVRVLFVSKEPHNTLGLNVWADVNAEPKGLYEALEKIGWKKDEFCPAPPLPAGLCGVGYAKDDQTMVIKHHFFKGGKKGLFNGWGAEEKKEFLPQARTVLRKFGFVRVAHHKLTLAELL